MRKLPIQNMGNSKIRGLAILVPQGLGIGGSRRKADPVTEGAIDPGKEKGSMGWPTGTMDGSRLSPTRKHGLDQGLVWLIEVRSWNLLLQFQKVKVYVRSFDS